MPKLVLPKGLRFKHPESDMGYTVARDIYAGEKRSPDQFEAFGGAPEPKKGHAIPDWFVKAVREYLDNANRP